MLEQTNQLYVRWLWHWVAVAFTIAGSCKLGTVALTYKIPVLIKLRKKTLTTRPAMYHPGKHCLKTITIIKQLLAMHLLFSYS